MSTPNTVGARMRYWRMRRGGMTQAVLAGLAGVSQSFISQVEAGRKSIERRSTLIAIAGALRVTVADLLGQPGDPTDPLMAEAAAAVPAVWAALIELEEGERRRPTMTRAELDAALEQMTTLRARAEYVALLRLLPALLVEAAAHSDVLLAQVAYTASTCLRHLGYRHLALPAARIARTAAMTAEHPAWTGAARFAIAQGLPIEAAALASRASDRALVDLQADAADPGVRQMLGQLHLSAALVCAADRRPNDAQAHLDEAAQEAASLGEPQDGGGFNLCGFGPTNVELWRMSVAAELGEWGRVVEIAEGVRPNSLRMSNRHQAYWIDLGRALAHSGRDDPRAVQALAQAEQAAPIAFVTNSMVHDVIAAMVHRAKRRAIPDNLRTLAQRVGIDTAA